MKPDIYILSASDRYNYGDLLFPIITIKELAKYGDYTFHNVAIIKSDLRNVGALQTYKYSHLYSVDNKKQKSFLIVAGGEVLGVNWMKLYSFIHPAFSGVLKLLSKAERAISKTNFFLRNPIPFVPTHKNITKSFKIIFHSVGGEKVGPKQLKNRVSNTFKSSLYFSIREKKSFESIKNTYSLPNLRLTPDSAMVISDHYKFNPHEKNEYIAFQVGHFKNGGNLELINQELFELYSKTKLNILFVPIGNCPGHDDILSLTWLKQNAKYPCEVLTADNLERIMGAIALSKLFIGTSLHGIITAMSFAVPYVALNPSISKLKNYIETWSPEPLNEIADFNEICTRSINAINVDKAILVKNANMQKDLVRESFKKISAVINNNSRE